MNIKEPQFRTVTCASQALIGRYNEMLQSAQTETFAGKEWAVVKIDGNTVTLQEIKRVRPTGMQYVVLQGRMPQDGSKPDTALILFPAWVSATLLCAGICGRVIELTDGSIVEGAVLSHDGTEQDLLDEIRSELGSAQQRVTDPAPARAEGMEPAPPPAPHVEPAVNVDQIREDAYREGMQADRDNLIKALANKGYTKPDNMGLGEWLRAAMEAYKNAGQEPALPLVRHKDGCLEKCAASACPCQDAPLYSDQAAQARIVNLEQNIAELEANLDAWRTAANANEALILNYGDTGIIKGIGINVEQLASVQLRDQEIDKLRGLLKNIRKLSKQGKE